MSNAEPTFDEIGPWSEIKLDIVRKYATAYSKILSAQTNPRLHHLYVDAFAGGGMHLSRTSGEFVLGSPLNALNVQPPFREYHFIDLDSRKVSALRDYVQDRPDVHIYEENCNTLLKEKILPCCRYKDFRRALWLLDPYGLHLDWSVVEMAGREKTIDIFLNFPIMDINRNVLRLDRSKVKQEDKERMDAFWGDSSWQEELYPIIGKDLFGEEMQEKRDNDAIAGVFRKRLRKVAGFAEVPEPMPMRNARGAIVYYLFFASQQPVAHHIVKSIFEKYGKWRPK
jgi:three-Cys-motif partner protein